MPLSSGQVLNNRYRVVKFRGAGQCVAAYRYRLTLGWVFLQLQWFLSVRGRKRNEVAFAGLIFVAISGFCVILFYISLRNIHKRWIL